MVWPILNMKIMKEKPSAAVYLTDIFPKQTFHAIHKFFMPG